MKKLQIFYQNHGLYPLEKMQILPLFANKQAERRRSACEAASLMPREVLVLQQEKFSIVL